MLFIKYSTSNIILRIEVSIVNLKVIFLCKKAKADTPERLTQDRRATFIYNRNGRFHTRDAGIIRVRQVIRLIIRVR